jgi:hypothetical protein
MNNTVKDLKPPPPPPRQVVGRLEAVTLVVDLSTEEQRKWLSLTCELNCVFLALFICIQDNTANVHLKSGIVISVYYVLSS